MTKDEKIVEAVKFLKETGCEFELKFYPAENIDIGMAIDTIHTQIANIDCLSSDEEYEYVIIKTIEDNLTSPQ